MILPAGATISSAANVVPMLKPDAAATSTGLSQITYDVVAPQPLDRVSLTVKAGESLLAVFRRAGIPAAESYRDVTKLKGQIDARRLQPGDKITFAFAGSGKQRRVASVGWNGRRGASASVALLPGAAQPQGTQTADAAMVLKTMALHGSPALPRQLTESGLPPQVCEQVIMALNQARRPPVHGEMVKIVYQVPANAASGAAPQLRYTAYIGRDGKQHVFRYTPLATPAALQKVDIMPAAVVSLWQPLPGARISSPFGWRVHPVLHTKKFHKGVDYEAALGTPVIAAADGYVEDFGPRGTYGNYIRIRHSARLETAYAHLSGFAPTLDVGSLVHRGDIIGYVGMTGIATGPHLYYELLVDGRQIDPEGRALKEAVRQRLPQTASVP
jgi:murein DD-endopeptidase MepM/ murein hydrolase activator NlpD